jgi:hypothetical protein
MCLNVVVSSSTDVVLLASLDLNFSKNCKKARGVLPQTLLNKTNLANLAIT